MLYTAVLDSNVLVPNVLNDVLMRLAERRLFRPLWSQAIFSEVARTVLRLRPDIPPERIAYRLRCMDATFEDARVHGWESLVPALELPDPDDRHVLAAAIRGGADAIVTSNVRHFPATVLAGHGLECIPPDAFLLDHLDLSERTVATVLAELLADRRAPCTYAQLAGELERCQVASFADQVRRLEPT